NPGPLPPTAIRAVYREIMSACLALERPLRVAVLGPQATFSHAAALGVFGSSSAVVLEPSFFHIFDAVARGEADYGVVPIENSTEGVVNQTLDAFAESTLEIVGETVLPIHYCVLASQGTLADVRHVYSHWQSLAQCRGWLTEHVPEAETHEMPSTSAAAEYVKGKAGAAAVASEVAAKLYDLEILARRVEDDTTNRTRFVVIGGNPPKATGRDKTSIMFSVKHSPGILYRILGAFADRGISLTTIESRPMRGRPWEYVFFVDLDGHRSDPRVAEALDVLRDQCQMMRVLGSYPAAVGEGNERAKG
ncbi:MAG: prephenate dehydratase, partial [Myxococcales bacterium]|nr:prephenate dehydratase [Myxococcales bacterium]